jgi:hypothetical protein
MNVREKCTERDLATVSVRASPGDSVSFLNAKNRDFAKNYPTIASLNGYPNIGILDFSLAKNRRRE